MFWWLKFAVGVVGAVALGWFFSWLFCVPWQKWAAVLLQLLGLVWVLRGILQTRGITFLGIARSLLRWMGKREEAGTGGLHASQATMSGQGTVSDQGKLEPFTYSSATVSPEELEQRLARERTTLEAALRRLGLELRQRGAQSEAAQQEQLRRVREEIFQKHPQEVMGIGWAAVGILLSGF